MKIFYPTPLFLVLIALISCNEKSNQQTEESDRKSDLTTIYLIRHAEKQTGSNPSLTEKGVKRAESWTEYFFLKDVDHILSSDYNRTRQTASPLAKSKSKEVEIYNVKSLTGEDLLEKYRGETVVLFGHSNTIHQYANDLQSEETFEELNESVYNKFIIVRVDANGKANAQWQEMDFFE
jgi:broad specificity phosphatase PhoE